MSEPEPTKEENVAETSPEKKNTTDHSTEAQSTGALIRAPRHVQRHTAKLVESNNRGLLNFSPMEKRIAIGAGRIGINIADGLLFSTHKVLGPVVTAGFAIYGLATIAYDYHSGALNRLGYRTSKTDVALRVGKEVATTLTGLAIGTAVGTLIGMSSIPVVSQLVLGTVLSVGLGLIVGTLITRYADRLFVRLQIRNQYKYPRGRKGARRRFEELLSKYEDLNVAEVSRIVQHYADYRVASGWESPNEIDYYRNADGDPRFMPVSFQHFAMVQLERRWGFLRNRASCRKVFKALMLTHHPDRGGSAQLAAQLKTDYEIYAFCSGWMGDCPVLLSAEVPNENPEVHEQYNVQTHRKRNAVKEFFRSLFRPVTNSAVDAEDLHRYGLLTIDHYNSENIETIEEIQNMEETVDDDSDVVVLEDALDGVDEESDDNELDHMDSTVRRQVQVNNRLVQQASIFRVLTIIQQTYQNTAEVITFSSLVKVYENKPQWDSLRGSVQLYNRLQCFIRFSKEVGEKQYAALVPFIDSGRTFSCGNFRWTNTEEAVKRRDEVRQSIMNTVFTPETNSLLEGSMSLYQSGKSLADNYFQQQREDGKRKDLNELNLVQEQTTNILETLTEIQRKLQEYGKTVEKPWRETVKSWTTSTEEETKLIGEIKEIGFTASTALAAEHAKLIHPNEKEVCDRYFSRWKQSQNTIRVIGKDLEELEAILKENKTSEEKTSEKEAEVLDQKIQDFSVKLLLMQKEAAEVDMHVKELYDISHLYFPETVHDVESLPSTCIWCVDPDIIVPRWCRYERERPLRCYSHMEVESKASIDPVRLDTGNEILEFDLLRATFTSPLDNTVRPCWLKRYTLPPLPLKEDEDMESSCSPDYMKGEQLRALVQVIKQELIVSDSCVSPLILSPTDMFCDHTLRAVFFHVPRDPTQHRFKSVHDIKKRIEARGIAWLHEALQGVIDLHYSNIAHGNLSLSSFTYDDFGNVQLGLFSRVDNNDLLDFKVPWKVKEAQAKDVVDLGGLLLSEVIPYLTHTARGDPSSPNCAVPNTLDRLADDVGITTEVAERLLGRQEPRWSLVEARNFVRRYMDANKGALVPKEDEFSPGFHTVPFPPSWGLRYGAVPIIVTLRHRMQLNQDSVCSCLYLNRNLPLWEAYTEAVKALTTTAHVFTQPSSFQKVTGVLPSSDDQEVNERFLWYSCSSEENAWSICMNGFTGGPQAVSTFAIKAPGKEKDIQWGLVCRVAVGTVVEEEGDNTSSSNGNQRGVYNEATGEVKIPAWRCYPEYICQRLL